jgi:hypothetical protein
MVSVGGVIFSLQIGLLYFCGKPQLQVIEQDLLVIERATDTSSADFDAVSRVPR